MAENTKYLVHASYLEIYNEDVRDLLSKNVKDKLEVGGCCGVISWCANYTLVVEKPNSIKMSFQGISEGLKIPRFWVLTADALKMFEKLRFFFVNEEYSGLRVYLFIRLWYNGPDGRSSQ